MNTRGSLTWLRAIALSFGLLAPAVFASTASAQTNIITACGQTCEDDCGIPSCKKAISGKCVLTSNVSCTSGQGAIRLVGGNDLDLQGYDVTCTATSPSSCIYPAIDIVDPNSKVTSSDDDDPSVISGPFLTGVDCLAEANAIVEHVTINDGIFGILNCETVRHNVIGPSSDLLWGGNMGISTGGVANGESITENYISGRTLPIFSTSALTLNVEKNVIQTNGSSIAITLASGQSSSAGNVRFNIFFGDAGTTLFSTPGTDVVNYDGNFCDPSHPDCGTCIGDDRCMPYTSPFIGN